MAEDLGSKKKPADHATDLKDLVIGYAKQETVDPLKTLGRYLGFGIGGAIAIGIGCVFLLLALLRALQSFGPMEYDTGLWSLIPYGATIIAAGVIIGLAIYTASKGDKKDSIQ